MPGGNDPSNPKKKLSTDLWTHVLSFLDDKTSMKTNRVSKDNSKAVMHDQSKRLKTSYPEAYAASTKDADTLKSMSSRAGYFHKKLSESDDIQYKNLDEPIRNLYKLILNNSYESIISCEYKYTFDDFVAPQNADNKTPLQLIQMKNNDRQKLYDHFYKLATTHFIDATKKDNSVDTKLADKYGYTVLLCATIYNQSVATLQKLITDGADTTIVDKTGSTLLMHAAENRNTKSATALLEQKNIPIDAKNHAGATAVYIAAKNGDLPLIQLFHTNEANLNIELESKEGNYSPLRIAVFNGHFLAVDYLLANKAIVIPTNNQQPPLLHLAAQKGHTEIVKRLLRHPDVDINAIYTETNGTALHTACRNNHEDIVEILLTNKNREQKINIKLEQKDKDGYTPLLLAVRLGFPQIVKQLLIAGADPEATINDLNALELAEALESTDIKNKANLSKIVRLLQDNQELRMKT